MMAAHMRPVSRLRTNPEYVLSPDKQPLTAPFAGRWKVPSLPACPAYASVEFLSGFRSPRLAFAGLRLGSNSGWLLILPSVRPSVRSTNPGSDRDEELHRIAGATTSSGQSWRLVRSVGSAI